MRILTFSVFTLCVLATGIAQAAPQEWAVRRAKMQFVKGHGSSPEPEITLTLMMREGADAKPEASSLVIDGARRYPVLWTDVREGNTIYYGNKQAIYSVHLTEKSDHSRWDADVGYDLASYRYTGVPEEVQ